MRAALLISLFGAAAFANAVDIEKFRLKSSTKYVKASDAVKAARLVKRGSEYIDTATELVKSVAPDAEFRVITDHYVGTNGIGHVNFRQTANGIDIDNAIFNVNIAKDGSIFSYGSSFFNGNLPSKDSTSQLGAVEALGVASKTLELGIETSDGSVSEKDGAYIINGISGTKEDPKSKKVYIVKPDGKLALTWKVDTKVKEAYYSSYVDVDSAEVVGVSDHVSHGTFEVYPIGINDPWEGERSIIIDPEETTASPNRWLETYYGYNCTVGNNIQAAVLPQSGRVTFSEPNAEGTYVFDYTPDGGDPVTFRDAAVTQAFYTTNMLHDLYYLLGFTPAAGNFQRDNYGQGGLANDPVQVYIQVWNGMNNGMFSHSVDGETPTLTMYLFDKTDPQRDGAFDQGFLIHEYTHGLSGRLTGGPATDTCLDDWEADGMAEGWSDLFASALAIKPDDTSATAEYGFAAWPLNVTNPRTARLVMYSTNRDVNNWTYSNANGLEKVHQVGTVWATMLYDILWSLIDKHGKNDNPRPDFDANGVPTDGKFLMLKILTDAFAIQPCNPTFVQARDAIIDSDQALTGGANKCEIWKGFANRGLGANAVFNATNRVDNFDLPDGVCS
ncbi:unnamed protein product [Clonostachys rosea f. rosea IK726]|uniref:Extracellular metalloproteinase n=2 Tax=Bionectria ochroleuca TaxID=29856 RepID=A0A0B7JZQ8_BIOOC|nr:unnamed protein product [Clonostachys rosea f. rosea IK726]